jgi:hypothetical protein
MQKDGVDGEEVTRDRMASLGVEEPSPRLLATACRWVEPGVFEGLTRWSTLRCGDRGRPARRECDGIPRLDSRWRAGRSALGVLRRLVDGRAVGAGTSSGAR